jgi:hypothetical protein
MGTDFARYRVYARVREHCAQNAIFAGRVPTNCAIQNAHRMLFNNADFSHERPRSGRPRSARTPELIDEAAGEVFRRNGVISVAGLARRLAPNADGTPAMSTSSARRILQSDLGLRPFRFLKTHQLHFDDLIERFDFSQQLIGLIEADPTILDRLVVFDECLFRQFAPYNAHNHRYWSTVNEHRPVEQERYCKSVMVLGGIWSGGVFGPWFFEGNVNGDTYLFFLRTYVVPQIIATVGPDAIFMHDGARAHIERDVRAFLQQQFPDGRFWARTGGNGPQPHPARSPDLCLWGWVKDVVFEGGLFVPANREVLMDCVRNAFELINEMARHSCRAAMEEFKSRLERCVANLGGSVLLQPRRR